MRPLPTIGKYAVENPYTISCEETLECAERVMGSHRIRHLPVMDGKKVFGVISDRDLAMAKAVHAGRQPLREIFVKDICIYDPYVVDENQPIDVVLSTMAKRRLGSVIITKDKKVSGIFTTVDACRLLASVARGEGW